MTRSTPKYKTFPKLPNPATVYKNLPEDKKTSEGFRNLFDEIFNMSCQTVDCWLPYYMEVLKTIYPKLTEDQIKGKYANVYLSAKMEDKAQGALRAFAKELLLQSPLELELSNRNKWFHQESVEYSEHNEPEYEALLKRFVDEQKILEAHSYNELLESNIVVTKEYAEQYISISVRASVWTFYVDGIMTIGDKEYTLERVSYQSEATRL